MSKLDLIEICTAKDTWEQAIVRGVNLLVNHQIATPSLAPAIIQSTKDLGPYYVIMPNVALAHTNVGAYNIKPGISLVVYANPVIFGPQPHHQVNLLFVLSAVDSQSHMNLLANFASVMGQEGVVKQILKCQTKAAIYEIIKEFL